MPPGNLEVGGLVRLCLPSQVWRLLILSVLSLFWYRTRILGDVVAEVGRDCHERDQHPQEQEEERPQSCPKGSDSSATKSEIHWVIDVQEEGDGGGEEIQDVFPPPPQMV